MYCIDEFTFSDMSFFILTDIQKILEQILKKLQYFNKLENYKYKKILDVEMMTRINIVRTKS